MTTNLTDLFARIQEAIDECGPTMNKHDRAVVAITHCIGDGIHTKTDIIRVLVTYGFTGGHIDNMLNNRKGPYRNADFWRVDADGRYHLLDEAA
jgi:hypothetical protein